MAELRKTVQDLLPRFRGKSMFPIMRELIDRIYVLRNQLFHGASTKGSKLNRKTLTNSTAIMADLIPAFIEIMLTSGIDHDWGNVCFPPVEK
jgi:hypothetical protein